MADRRLVAQSVTTSSQVSQLVRRCGPWAGLLFSWAIPFIDDDSRLDGDPDTLRSIILGRFLDKVSVDDVREYVATMNDLGLIVWYEVLDAPSERYIFFPRFAVHQSMRADRYGPSRRPPPPGWRPDYAHPYSKRPTLAQEKPQKDTRRTQLVPRRIDPQLRLLGDDSSPRARLTTTWQPGDNRWLPNRGVSSDSYLDVSHPLAEPAAQPGTRELRSGTDGAGLRERVAADIRERVGA